MHVVWLLLFLWRTLASTVACSPKPSTVESVSPRGNVSPGLWRAVSGPSMVSIVVCCRTFWARLRSQFPYNRERRCLLSLCSFWHAKFLCLHFEILWSDVPSIHWFQQGNFCVKVIRTCLRSPLINFSRSCALVLVYLFRRTTTNHRSLAWWWGHHLSQPDWKKPQKA